MTAALGSGAGEVELRGAGLAVFLGGAGESDVGGVRGPAGGLVVGAGGEANGSRARVGEVKEIEGGLVAGVIRGDGGLDKGGAAAVGGDLGVADPGEVEEILVGDGALLGRE